MISHREDASPWGVIAAGLQGVDFVVANTDAQALTMSMAKHVIQMGSCASPASGQWASGC